MEKNKTITVALDAATVEALGVELAGDVVPFDIAISPVISELRTLNGTMREIADALGNIAHDSGNLEFLAWRLYKSLAANSRKPSINP